MNFLQLKQEIGRRLGESADPQFWPLADLGSFINEAYILTASRLNLLETSATISLVEGQWLYDIASNCHCVSRVYCGTNELLVRPISWEKLMTYDSNWIQTSATSPMFYVMLKPDQIFFYPAPTADDADAITYHYTQIPTALSADGSIPGIPAHYHDILLDYAESIALLRERTPSSKKAAMKCMVTYRDKLDGLRRKRDDISSRPIRRRAWGS